MASQQPIFIDLTQDEVNNPTITTHQISIIININQHRNPQIETHPNPNPSPKPSPNPNPNPQPATPQPATPGNIECITIPDSNPNPSPNPNPNPQPATPGNIECITIPDSTPRSRYLLYPPRTPTVMFSINSYPLTSSSSYRRRRRRRGRRSSLMPIPIHSPLQNSPLHVPSPPHVPSPRRSINRRSHRVLGSLIQHPPRWNHPERAWVHQGRLYFRNDPNPLHRGVEGKANRFSRWEEKEMIRWLFEKKLCGRANEVATWQRMLDERGDRLKYERKPEGLRWRWYNKIKPKIALFYLPRQVEQMLLIKLKANLEILRSPDDQDKDPAAYFAYYI